MGAQLLKYVYVRELDGFYDALGRLQTGVAQMAKSVNGADLRPGLEVYLTQMLDLGQRIDRIFALIHDKSPSVGCQGADEMNDELHELIESKCLAELVAKRGAASLNRGKRVLME